MNVQFELRLVLNVDIEVEASNQGRDCSIAVECTPREQKL